MYPGEMASCILVQEALERRWDGGIEKELDEVDLRILLQNPDTGSELLPADPAAIGHQPVEGFQDAARDPLGFRPLCLGRFQDSYVVASESCAFDIIGARYLRDVEPGEMVVLGEGELVSRRVAESARECRCVFEHVYFSRPDSRVFGRCVSQVRKRLGMELARSEPAEADLVVPDKSLSLRQGRWLSGFNATAFLIETAAGLATFPLPKEGAAVQQFWVFKESTDNAATLPATALHLSRIQTGAEPVMALEAANF